MAAGIINLQKASGGITKISSADGTGVTELVVPESGNIVSVDAAVTDNAIARYDGTTGKLQNSGVVIGDNGNVGIGTTTPTARLDVVTMGGYSVVRTNNGTSTLNFGVSIDNSTFIENTTEQPIRFITNYTERMILDPQGNLLLTSGTGALGYGAGGTVTQLTSKSTAVTLNKPSGVIFSSNSALAAGASAVFLFNNNLIKVYDNVIVSGNDHIYRVESSATGNGYCSIRISNISGSSLSQIVEIAFQVVKGAQA